MRKNFYSAIIVIISLSVSTAQNYTEILDGGWGSAAYGCKPAVIDLDNDGLLDLIVGEYLGNISHYEQDGISSTDFVFQSYLIDQLVIGKFTAPSFIDLDNDDLIDMIIGEQSGNLNHFEQDEINSLNFILVSEYFNEIDVGGGSRPTFADIDNNGLLDMLIGHNAGIISHYQQDTINSNSFVLISDSLSGIDIGKWSTPTIIDLDEDDFLDLIVGSSSGVIYHFEQDEINSLNFTLISEKFNDIQENSPVAPTFTDLDNNGLLDMIIGDDDVFLNHYEQNDIGSVNFNFIADKFIEGVIDVGSSAVPCFTDLDNDGLLDMIVGEYNGFINHYEQNAIGSENFNLYSENFNEINEGIYSSPVITNLGNNDLLDLIIGYYD
ncbi:MAG: VCBS repeat-containing protein, partial [Melioribacteraceae bacterium]|nr:VCBS repeat-containing protein [Melioribacteraceae bacterium]